MITDYRSRSSLVPDSGLPVVYEPDNQSDENWNLKHAFTFLHAIQPHNVLICPRFPFNKDKMSSADPNKRQHKRKEWVVLSFKKHNVYNFQEEEQSDDELI